MWTVFLTLLLVVMLFPASSGFSQFSDTAPSLTVLLDSNPPFVYRDGQGYTVVVGQVINNDSLTSVTNVQVSARFYDDRGDQPLESNIGSTVLESIPPSGFSPYVIKSQSPNPAITQVTVHLEGFDPSPPKINVITVQAHNMSYVNDTLYFSGVLENNGPPISGTNVHVALYDGFEPPRIISVHSIPLVDILPEEPAYFDFNERINPQAVGFYMFSESDVFYSDFIDVRIPDPETFTKLVTIKNIAVKDESGNALSAIPVGSKINIQSDSWIRFSADQPSNETPYTYYVQVKRFGATPYVEFLGQYDGKYMGTAPQSPSIDWLPESKGEFFIETFVWDKNNVPISNPGPFALVSVR